MVLDILKSFGNLDCIFSLSSPNKTNGMTHVSRCYKGRMATRGSHPPVSGPQSNMASQLHSSSEGHHQVLMEHSTNLLPYSSSSLSRAQTSGSSNSSMTHHTSNFSRGRSHRSSHQCFKHGQSKKTLDKDVMIPLSVPKCSLWMETDSTTTCYLDLALFSFFDHMTSTYDHGTSHIIQV